jgi:predicted dinucleotide-binding enzyme
MANPKVGVLGSGAVGQVLAEGFMQHGHDVMRGSSEPKKLEEWRKSKGPTANTGSFAEAARFGELLVLAVKGLGAEKVLDACGDGALDGKTIIDTTNPIADAPPVNGVLQLFTGPNESLMERLQAHVPQAKFVKAFSCVGNRLMVEPLLAGNLKPTMFMCGNDAAAKAEVQAVLAKFGWEWEDLGAATAARAIEPLVSLWCIPGFLQNDWSRAYKVLKPA